MYCTVLYSIRHITGKCVHVRSMKNFTSQYRVPSENGDVGALPRAGGADANDAGLPPVVEGVGPAQVQEGGGVRHLAPCHPLLLM